MANIAMPAFRDGAPILLSGLGATDKPVRLNRLPTGSSAPIKYNEALLEKLVDKSPEILPLFEIEPAFNGAQSICRQLPMRGTRERYADNLLMTADGRAVLVECKLLRNSQARREVVAQLFDYLSALARWSYSDLEAAVQQARGDRQSLYELSGASGGRLDEPRFAEAVSHNLQRGNILGLIVGDGISAAVHDIIDFLGGRAMTRWSVGLVQLEIYELPGEQPQFLVHPRTFARTQIIPVAVALDDSDCRHQGQPEAAPGVPRKPTTLTKEIFFEELANAVSPELVKAAKGFIADCEHVGCEIVGASASLKIIATNPEGDFWNLGCLMKNGDIWIWALRRRDQAAGRTTGQHYMEGIISLVPAAYIREPAKPGNSEELKKKGGGYLTLDDLMPIRDRWLEIIQGVVDEIRSPPNDGNRFVYEPGDIEIIRPHEQMT